MLKKFKSIVSRIGDPELIEDPARVEEVELLCSDPDETIEFIKSEIDGEDLSYISEIFEELFIRIYSPQLVEALYAACDRFPKENAHWLLRYNLDESLKSADVESAIEAWNKNNS